MGDFMDFINKELVRINFYNGKEFVYDIEVAINKLNVVRNKFLIRSRNEKNIYRSC